MRMTIFIRFMNKFLLKKDMCQIILTNLYLFPQFKYMYNLDDPHHVIILVGRTLNVIRVGDYMFFGDISGSTRH